MEDVGDRYVMMMENVIFSSLSIPFVPLDQYYLDHPNRCSINQTITIAKFHCDNRVTILEDVNYSKIRISAKFHCENRVTILEDVNYSKIRISAKFHYDYLVTMFAKSQVDK